VFKKANITVKVEEPKVIPRAPIITLQSPSSTGQMAVKFSKAMIYPESWYARLKTDKASFSEIKSGKRLLKEIVESSDADVPHPIISI
jgi:hypothetical protein